jgi:hypothetical protein
VDDDSTAFAGHAGGAEMSSSTDDRTSTFLEVGIWLLFFALLVPAAWSGT